MIIIIITDFVTVLVYQGDIHVSLTDVQVYIISSKSHTMTTSNYDKD